MASIYRRGRIWWVHYLVGGKSVSRSPKTTSERVAQDRRKKLEALELTDQLFEPSKTPVASIVQEFCEFLLATRTRKSAKNDMAYLRGFFGPCCAALELGSNVPHKFRDNQRSLPKVPDRLAKRHMPVKRLEQISTEMVGAYIHARVVEDGIAPKTANRIREVLHRLFCFATEHRGYVCPDRRYRNPVEGVRRAKEKAPVISWLTREQITQQLAVLDEEPTLKAMVATYIYAGLRREEAMWLTRDVNAGRKPERGARTGGRPLRRRDRHREKSRNVVMCRRFTVAGCIR